MLLLFARLSFQSLGRCWMLSRMLSQYHLHGYLFNLLVYQHLSKSEQFHCLFILFIITYLVYYLFYFASLIIFQYKWKRKKLLLILKLNRINGLEFRWFTQAIFIYNGNFSFAKFQSRSEVITY